MHSPLEHGMRCMMERAQSTLISIFPVALIKICSNHFDLSKLWTLLLSRGEMPADKLFKIVKYVSYITVRFVDKAHFLCSNKFSNSGNARVGKPAAGRSHACRICNIVANFSCSSELIVALLQMHTGCTGRGGGRLLSGNTRLWLAEPGAASALLLVRWIVFKHVPCPELVPDTTTVDTVDTV